MATDPSDIERLADVFLAGFRIDTSRMIGPEFDMVTGTLEEDEAATFRSVVEAKLRNRWIANSE